MPLPAARARRMRALLLAALLAGAPPACSSSTEPGAAPLGPQERALTLEIDSAWVPCVGIGPRECLRTREAPTAPWEFFYEHIEGFVFEPGYRYVLRVAERPVPDPPADGSSLAYRLLEVVSKTPTP